MKAIIVIHNLTDYNAHLMPWRTVCEVVDRVNNTNCGLQLRLVSLSDHGGSITGSGIPPGTVSISKSRDKLAKHLSKIVIDWGGDAVLWPVAWREPGWRTRVVGGLGVPVIAHFPGGVYTFRDAIYATRRIGLRKALPYLMDAMWHKRTQLRRLHNNRFCHLITMTTYTAEATITNGWSRDRVTAIPPGRDDEDSGPVVTCLPDVFVSWLKKRPFFLFAGPPSGIRGIYELLEAFDRLAEQNQQACLVCLFRSDAPLEREKIANVITRMRHHDRVYVVWESVSKPQLESYMSACHGAVLPFVAVPSEIPLAIIETMKYEKPVITTMTGGTGDFVSKSGEVVPLGNISALASSMLKLLVDPDYYRDRCNLTRAAYAMHPGWDAIADMWCKCILNCLSADTDVEMH